MILTADEAAGDWVLNTQRVARRRVVLRRPSSSSRSRQQRVRPAAAVDRDGRVGVERGRRGERRSAAALRDEPRRPREAPPIDQHGERPGRRGCLVVSRRRRPRRRRSTTTAAELGRVHGVVMPRRGRVVEGADAAVAERRRQSALRVERFRRDPRRRAGAQARERRREAREHLVGHAVRAIEAPPRHRLPHAHVQPGVECRPLRCEQDVARVAFRKNAQRAVDRREGGVVGDDASEARRRSANEGAQRDAPQTCHIARRAADEAGEARGVGGAVAREARGRPRVRFFVAP
mmetsp:Transcript_21940/g.87085  ORF Transcript_21940/g.87085 Transcript_21940/m.87085 type:complete len:291 (+) Transcript_21940:39-911(+)